MNKNIRLIIGPRYNKVSNNKFSHNICIISIAFFGLIFCLSACATTYSSYKNLDPEDKNAIHTLTGGILGAAVQTNALGAIAGAFVGDIATNLFVKEKPIPIEIEDEEAKKKNGRRTVKLFIEELSIAPQQAKKGSTIEANVRYTLYAIAPAKEIEITEIVALTSADNKLELFRREITREEGEHTSVIKFIIPQGTPEGDYVILTTVSIGNYTKKARSTVKVI